MKTLEEHNAERLSEIPSGDPCLNGIECPKCGNELIDSCPKNVLTSYPAQKSIHCSKCAYRGYRLV